LPRLVALNKADMPDAGPMIETLLPRLEAAGEQVRRISALTGDGVSELVYALSHRLDELPRPEPAPEVAETRFTAPEEEASWSAEQEGEGVFRVGGRGVERLIVMTDMENEAALRRLQRILERMGVVRELRELGASDGDTVRIGEVEFDFLE
jgi:GTPase